MANQESSQPVEFLPATVSPISPNPGPRRFGILDLIALILALGPGLAFTRAMLPTCLEYAGRINWTALRWPNRANLAFMESAHAITFIILAVALAALCFVLFLTFAFLLLRLRRPRPIDSQLFQQPGLVGCLAGLAGATIPFVLSNRPGFNYALSIPALAVLLMWSIRWAKRRLKPEASWIDRFGRALAVGWILFPSIIFGLALFIASN